MKKSNGTHVIDTALLALPILMVSFDAFARAGGGSSGHCGWLCIVLYPFILLYSGYVGIRINQKQRQVSSALAKMAVVEPQWSEENLVDTAREKFTLLQAAWGEQNLEIIKNNLHPALFPSWETDIKSQISRNEKNIMSGLSISKLRIVDVKNFKDDERDEFTVAIDATANDQTIKDGNIIKSDNSKFREFWTFEWEEGKWALREVVQADGWKRFVNASIIYEKSK